MKHNCYLFTSCLIVFVLISCSSPIDSFERTNPNDPLSPSFKGELITGLQATADSTGIITLRWEETKQIVTKIVIEKSLADTLSFSVIAELSPDIHQFSDSSGVVRKGTYYRVSLISEIDGRENQLFGKSQVKLEFGEILSHAFKFLNENNRLKLIWNTDVPFFTHFTISTNNVISESNDRKVTIPANKIENVYIDPLKDIDFETRNYTITGIIQDEDFEDTITQKTISFEVTEFFKPKNLEIHTLNEQDWRISWESDAFFATGAEVIRISNDGDIDYKLPEGSTFFIDSILFEDNEDTIINQYRRYRVRLITETASSNYTDIDKRINILPLKLMFPSSDETNPNTLKLAWTKEGLNADLIKEIIVEKLDQSEKFVEIARVDGNLFSFTDANINPGETPTYRIKSLTSRYSDPQVYLFSHDYEMQVSLETSLPSITSIESTSDNRYIAAIPAISFSLSEFYPIYVWDLETQQVVNIIDAGTESIADFKISNDDRFIYYSVPSKCAIYRADFPATTNKEKVIVDGCVNSSGTLQISLSNDGSFLAGTGGRGFVKKWDLNTFESDFVFAEFETPTVFPLKNIAISPNDNLIGGNNGESYIMDAISGSIQRKLIPFTSASLTDLQFSPDGEYYTFSDVSTNSTHIYSTNSWERLQVISGKRADFHPVQSTLVSFNNDGVYTYNLSEGTFTDFILDDQGNGPIPSGQLNKITFVDEHSVAIVTGSNSKNIELWKRLNTQRWKAIKTIFNYY